jgi:MFS family permease
MDSNLETPLLSASVATFDWQNLSTAAIGRARIATGAMFFLNGCAFSTWASRIPSIQDKLHVGTGLLGIALLSMAVGALIAMCFAGRLIATLGSRPTIGVMASCAAICLAVAGLPDNLILLSLVITVFGLTLGTMDVAMNSHAVVVEKVFRRPIMSGFHALFSIGGIFGACGGAAIAHLNIKPEWHFLGIALLLLLLNAIAYKFLLPSAVDKSTKTQGGVNIKESLSYFTKDQALVAISVIMFCCFLTEGAIGDWSSVFMHSVLNTDTGTAALGYAAFSVTMAIGRFSGDLLVARLGQLLIVRAGSALAALGLALVLVPCALPVPLSIFGFALIGIGVANIVPIAFSAAGNVKGISAASAIATVALIGYFGLLAGPPLIGFLAEIVTLRLALIVIAALLATMMFYSKWLASEQV